MVKAKEPSTGNKSKVSALKKLRTSLKEAGFIGPNGTNNKGSLSKKKRQGKIAADGSKDDRKVKLNAIKDAFNPFEIKTSKKKHDIIGRTVKGVSGRPTLSKQIGIDNRKKTLLVEYKNKNRTGTIIDRRFGENDTTLTPEEKMLERFTREKQKKARGGAVFNLDDDNDQLTHFGQSLANMDEFDDPVLSDEEGNGAIDKDTVRYDHFGGFEPNDNDPNRVKSKSEVMKEVIAKSKMHKYERQKNKEDDEDMRRELDGELDVLKALLLSSNSDPPTRKPLASQNTLFKKLVEPEKRDEKVEDEYDQFVRQMAFEQKAQATDRLKTEEEIALEEKASLEKAERHRLRRMQGEDSDTDEEESGSKHKQRKKPKRVSEGDDLGDDFEEPDSTVNFGLGEGVKVRVIDPAAKDDPEGEDEFSGMEESTSEEDGDDEEDESEYSDEMDEEDGSDLEDSNIGGKSSGHSKPLSRKRAEELAAKAISASKELPYSFPIPQTFDDYFELVKGRPVSDHVVLLKRVRTLYHVKLGGENKSKLEVFAHVLLTYVAYITDSLKDGEDLVELFDVYCQTINSLAQQIPDSISRAAILFITETHTQFKEELASVDPVNGPPSECPSSGQLLVFTYFTKLFSTSDYHHAVISPLQLFMGQILLQSPVISPKCLTRSLFISGLCYEIQIQSNRFVPEAINALLTILVSLIPESNNGDKLLKEQSNLMYNRFQLNNSSLKKYLAKDIIKAYKKVNFDKEDPKGLKHKLQFTLLNRTFDDPYLLKPVFLTNLLITCLRQLRKFADMYSQHSGPQQAFPQIFTEVGKFLVNISDKEYFSKDLQKLICDQGTYINALCERIQSSRTQLQLQNHRPVAIKSYVPKFEAEYSVDRHYDPNPVRNEQNKLQRLHKRELKGAIRELKKDAHFLAGEKLANIKAKDKEYQDKIRAITGEIANTKGDSAKFNYESKHKKIG